MATGWRVMAATKALIIAAQDGALVTEQYRSQVWSAGGSTRCRACGNIDEMIGHVLLSCEQYK